MFALTLCFPCLLPALSLPSAAVQLSFPSSFRSIILFSVLTDPTSVPKGEAGKLDRRAVGLRSLYSLIPCSPSLPSSPHRPSSKPSIAAPSASELYIKQPSPGQRVKDRQMDTLTAHGEFTGKAFFPVLKKINHQPHKHRGTNSVPGSKTRSCQELFLPELNLFPPACQPGVETKRRSR